MEDVYGVGRLGAPGQIGNAIQRVRRFEPKGSPDVSLRLGLPGPGNTKERDFDFEE